jgi:hypothetical protein
MTSGAPVRRRRVGLALLVLGFAITAVYYGILVPSKLLGLGQPTDIGGGLIPLTGIIVAGVGIVLSLSSLRGGQDG